jgi:hypothetical protein
MLQFLKRVGPIGMIFDAVMTNLKGLVFLSSVNKKIEYECGYDERDDNRLPIFLGHASTLIIKI